MKRSLFFITIFAIFPAYSMDETPDSSELELFQAVKAHNTEEIKRLVGGGVSVNCTVDLLKDTPLHEACYPPSDERTVQTLIDLGADIHAKNLLRSTPLHHACGHRIIENQGLAQDSSRNPALIKKLIALGAQVNAKSAGAQTPLHIARIAGDRVLSSALIQAGAKPDAKDFVGMRPCDYMSPESRIQDRIDTLSRFVVQNPHLKQLLDPLVRRQIATMSVDLEEKEREASRDINSFL